MTTKPVHVEFSNAGLRDLLAAGRWWTQHHPSRPTDFDDEVDTMIAFLEQSPEGAPLARSRRHKTARVKVMTKTGHLVLYRYAKSKRVVTIIGVFASRSTAERP